MWLDKFYCCCANSSPCAAAATAKAIDANTKCQEGGGLAGARHALSASHHAALGKPADHPTAVPSFKAIGTEHFHLQTFSHSEDGNDAECNLDNCSEEFI